MERKHRHISGKEKQRGEDGQPREKAYLDAADEMTSLTDGALDLPRCRFCDTPLRQKFVDLGMSPLCESYLSANQLNQREVFYPLHVRICDRCFLVQLEEYVRPENIFSDYAYFSSYSETWLAHAKAYAEQMTSRFHLNTNSLVVEVASNDGYLLQHFVAKQIPVLGIEPAANVASVAVEKGVPTLVKFFGTSTARELVRQGKQADLLLGNNVLAQVPDLNDFVAGMKILLRPRGGHHDRISSFDAPDGRESIRYDLSRTLFLFLLPDRREDLRCAWLDAFRCRGAKHAWRIPPNLRAPCRGQL